MTSESKIQTRSQDKGRRAGSPSHCPGDSSCLTQPVADPCPSRCRMASGLLGQCRTTEAGADSEGRWVGEVGDPLRAAPDLGPTCAQCCRQSRVPGQKPGHRPCHAKSQKVPANIWSLFPLSTSKQGLETGPPWPERQGHWPMEGRAQSLGLLPRPLTFTPTARPTRGPADSGLRLARAKVPEGMLVWAMRGADAKMGLC